jgi:hypothetical protein
MQYLLFSLLQNVEQDAMATKNLCGAIFLELLPSILQNVRNHLNKDRLNADRLNVNLR